MKKKRKKFGRKLLSFLLALAMVVGMMPEMNLTAYAATLDNESTTWSENSVIDGDVMINNNVTVNGDITLTIPEGKILTINGQSDYYGYAVIQCDYDSILTVSGGGTLIVNAPAEDGEHSSIDGICGNLIVDGATVQVTGRAKGVFGNVTVNSGSVCVYGGNGEAGGEGYSGISGVVTVNGGSITVVGGNGGNGDNGNGGSGGEGVFGDVIVNGGSATITGGNGGTKGSDTYASNGYIGQAVYGSITGNAEESEDNTNWTSVTGSTSEKQYIKIEPILVTGVSLDKTTAQTIDIDGTVAFTATVAPDGATDKTVKWSTTGGVTLYSDENCTVGNEIGADATSTLTVYAKGTAAGSATVTATSNADDTKSASCDVTVNAGNTTEYTTLQVGDVLRVGDFINSTTPYIVGDWSFSPASKPWTLVRADVSVSGIFPDLDVNVTESATGEYYLFKNGGGDYTIAAGEGNNLRGAYFTATNTSDGIYVASISGRRVSVAVYEPVTGVTLTPNTVQMIDIDGTVAFTATVAPDGATDKTVKWSTTGGVTLYSDENCTAGNEIGADATSTLTVYAKGTAAGSATVTATSNADSTKSASCNVTVNAGNTTEYTTLQVGDVLRVGDFINSTKPYIVGEWAFNPVFNPWTLVRADVSVSGIFPDQDVNVTESATGEYYLFKNGDGDYSIRAGEGNNLRGTYFTATNTSDGIYVASISYGRNVSVAVYEPVTGVTLTPNTAQTIDIDGIVAYTASVSPDNASDKKVKWSVGGTNADAVTLYSDEACATPVTLDTATETLTIYAKGVSAGSATVTATSNADSEKSASCEVTINKANAVAATVTANNRTYDGTEKPLVTVNNSTLVGGEMQYALGTATEATEAYTASIPTKTNTGTYYVWYKVVGDANHNNTEAQCVISKVVVPYDLWIGGAQVTSEDLRGTGWSFAPESNTLTLNGVDITEGYEDPYYSGTYGIYYSGNDSLSIVLSEDSDNKVGVTGNVQTGIESSRNITISGAGKLTVKGSGNFSVGIEAYALTIKDAEINVEGAFNGIQTKRNGYGVNIISGKVNAIGQTGTGIHSGLRDANYQTSAVTIGENAMVVAIGGNTAINYLKNAIAGTGWTDPEDNTSKTTISISSEGQSIDTLKKMAFPKLPDSTVTTPPEANNLTFTGSAQELVTAGVASNGEMQYAIGTNMTTAPTSGWGTSIPAKTDAGTYYVWYKVVGDVNHSNTEAQCVTAKIRAAISKTVTFKVANGSWNDGTTADKTVTLTGYEGDTLKLTSAQIPAVGSKAADTFKAGSWDVTPSTNTAITVNTTYTYTYAKKDTISATVTFKVANGSWNDGTTADKTVTLTGYEGDTLKLTADQIPAVGSKAADTFKAGSWDVTPSTNTAITANTTYTYTYAKKDTISAKVTFKVANGSWNDGTTADKTVTLTGYEGDTLKLTSAQIPAVGSKAADTFKAGSWDVTPSTNTAISQNTTYTYTYAKKDTISATVTFKVANGSWNDGKTKDVTVTLNGYEGDTLKLTADQIPAVGSKAADTFKAGSWDVTPSTNTAITANTTYTYTYAKKDTISAKVTFKVANGSWNDGTTADKTVTLTGYEGDTLKLTSAQIPAVGSKAADTFKAGSWDVTPSTNTAISQNTTYTYTYAKKDTISAKVTFKVVNGSWNDGKTKDVTVTLSGYEGDTLKLTADQIPAVGSKAADTFKVGSWDVTPSTNTAITANTTYTYTYAKKDTISAKVTFKVVNGSWNDGKTKDVTVTLSGYEGDTLKLTADQIPAVGKKAADTFKAGSWDVTPNTNTAITGNTTYTYTYAKKDTISAKVTFKVVNGSWNDGKTKDVTVTLSGYEGDTLKLTADQIPAVGKKAADTFKAGSWDVTPSTKTAITANTTYTYTYAKKDTISAKVTFKVVNGSWNDGKTKDVTVTLSGYEGDTLKLTADQIPAVGKKAADTFKAGKWDVTPNAKTAITGNTTYTYTYTKKDTISAKVTFKVANGSWNDGTTADKTVTLTGYEGDTLKLTADQIPAVGKKAAKGYKAGSWDVTPSTKTAIKANTTYTYTYVVEEVTPPDDKDGDVSVPEEKQKDNFAGGGLDNTGAEVKESVLTEEDKEQIQAGKNVEVWLEVKDQTETVAEEEKAKVEEAGKELGSDYQIGSYMDLKLWKQVEGKQATKVAEVPNGKVKVSITIPEKMRKANVIYMIIGLHNEKTFVLKPILDKATWRISFETNQFSTYALAYQEQEPETKKSVTEIFTDLDPNAWYINAVQFVYDHALMVGKSATTFDPNAPITREQMVQVIYNYEGKPEVPNAKPFNDVVEGSWYQNAVLWANANGVSVGYGGGRFGVADAATREQMVRMLYNYAILKGYDISVTPGTSDGYADSATISGWAKEAMDWAVEKGIISGKGTQGIDKSQIRLDPAGKASRVECAQVLTNFKQKIEK